MKKIIRTWLIGLGLVYAVSAVSAQAAEPAGRTSADGNLEVARAAFQRGVDFFHEGDFQSALAEFQKANLNGPSYRILYNMAQVYFELHDYVSAIKYYRQFLTDGGSEVPASRQSQVEETIQKLQTRVAHLKITSDVDGARVSVDDVPVGISPLPEPIQVNPGTHRISATKAGVAGASSSVTVAGTDRIEVALDLVAGANGSRSQDGMQGSKGAQPLEAAAGVSTSSNSESRVRWRAPLVAALATTGACAVAAGAFGWLAWRANRDFEHDLDTFKVSSARLDDDRSRLRTYAVLTEVALAGTLAAGGLSVYLALFRSGTDAGQTAGAHTSVAIVPMPTGAVLQGSW